jgi:DNA-binding transcriptional LysR family regulator
VLVRGSVVTNDSSFAASIAEQGLGLAYVLEPAVAARLRDGQLERVLDAFAPTVPGFWVFYPKRAQRSLTLRAFVETAKKRVPRVV